MFRISQLYRLTLLDLQAFHGQLEKWVKQIKAHPTLLNINVVNLVNIIKTIVQRDDLFCCKPAREDRDGDMLDLITMSKSGGFVGIEVDPTIGSLIPKLIGNHQVITNTGAKVLVINILNLPILADLLLD